MTTTVRRRARKQPAEVRREEVLDAAVRVFARESFRGAGTAEIAREAGIAEPTIYRHFSSKRDLYLRALERCCEVVRIRFNEIIAEQEDALGALLGMAAWYRQSIEDDPAYLRLRMRAAAETNDEDVRERLAAAYDGLVQIVADLVRRGQEQGSFKKHASPQGAAWMFMGVGQVVDLNRLLGMEGAASEKCLMDMGGIFWEMLVEPGAAMPGEVARS